MVTKPLFREENVNHKYRLIPLLCIVFCFSFVSSLHAQTPDAQGAPAPPSISLRDAIQRTIRSNPNVTILKETVVQAEGALQQASGDFDVLATSHVSAQGTKLPLDQDTERTLSAAGGEYPDHVLQETKSYGVGLSKLTRSGVSFSPSVSDIDVYDSSTGKAAQSGSVLNFNIYVPLLRNLGRDATGANELAKETNLKSARYATRYNISQLINITAASYWNCLASEISFNLTLDTQRRSQKLLDLVEALVRAGSLEAAALNQARANVLSNQVDAREQQKNVYIARQSLAISMGFTPRELGNTPSPAGDFPSVITIQALESQDVQRYVDAALKQRGDYLGAQTDIETAVILLRQAENLIKPRLDLSLNAGYNGLSEETGASRYYEALSSKLRGVNYLVSLNLELPIQNNTAKGNLVQRQSQVRATDMAIKGLANQIASDVFTAYETLRASVNEYKLAEQAEIAYQKAVDFETQKYKSGRSTLTAVIDVEGRYFSARVTRIDVLRKYAMALANFRHVTGSLLDHQGELEQFDLSRLLEFSPLTGKN
jgi:outer membrane protein TolC